ncbi:MAG TPA: excinuclease ABC subunit UvrB [Thermotogota bacterium]|nr:excinuclease ABC subunit UvrB [Thermotogota bacterium]HPR95691.1 excinuclease ABC subunit UvrB [Thermotogota bacterium]
MEFRLNSNYEPSGDQPQAIENICNSIRAGNRYQTLLGVTGSGKTFTMAHVIQKMGRQALIISPNKTLAAQLYREFKEFFPENRVEFFISYYDYYQPEAYIPKKDIYVEKEAQINEIIEKMRLSVLQSVLTHRDVIVIASVSCIYASGNPDDFRNMNLVLEKGKPVRRRDLTLKLTEMQYDRSEEVFKGGNYRLKGEILEIYPGYEDVGIRIEFFDDEVDRIFSFDPVTRSRIEDFDKIIIYPATEYVTTEEKIKGSIRTIEEELHETIIDFKEKNLLLEAQRIEQRTKQDLEMLAEVGYCQGIENYSRHFDQRKAGEPPWTLLDYFNKDFITIIDESHIAVPQLRGMSNGDIARKKNLIQYGFRLPSAADNRPLNFEEFSERVGQIVFTSATPGDFEMEHSDEIIQQIIRPTGLVDPEIEFRNSRDQIDDLLEEIRARIQKNERVLVITLTKSMSERLSEYLQELGIRSEYIHSELGTVERVEVLKKLRTGEIHVAVGINLLREGLDLPEVSLVAILDADREGFLRNERTLTQIVGRAARNANGKVIMYGDKISPAMQKTIEVTEYRRAIQMAYNEEHGITPKTIIKKIGDDMFASFRNEEEEEEFEYMNISDETKNLLKVSEDMESETYLEILEEEMNKAARELRFEDAAKLRDELNRRKAK